MQYIKSMKTGKQLNWFVEKYSFILSAWPMPYTAFLDLRP